MQRRDVTVDEAPNQPLIVACPIADGRSCNGVHDLVDRVVGKHERALIDRWHVHLQVLLQKGEGLLYRINLGAKDALDKVLRGLLEDGTVECRRHNILHIVVEADEGVV
jgi:hypothetical protein